MVRMENAVSRENQRSVARRWVGAAAAAAAVAGLVAAVQVATRGGDAATGGARYAGSAADTAAASAALFPVSKLDSSDTTRESTVDVAASWPVQACPAVSAVEFGSAEPGAVERGRVDFVAGTEHGPEYSRDLAIGWYADTAAAQAAYDALAARVGECAAETGARTAAAPWTPTAGAGSLLTVWSTIEGPFAEGSTYAVSVRDAVVVLAADHSEMIVEGPEAPDPFPGTAGHAERLLAEACRVAPDRC